MKTHRWRTTQKRRAPRSRNYLAPANRGDPASPARSVYGELRLGAGTILYHTSAQPFRTLPEKPLLFTTLSPGDYEPYDAKYITRIELLRPVSLFYMIGQFQGVRVLPRLDILIGKPGENLNKRYDHDNRCYKSYLVRDGFDGWITSVEGKHAVEVALINDPSMWRPAGSSEIIDEEIELNMNRNMDAPNSRWAAYPMVVVEPKFRINRHWQPEIEAYMTVCEQRRYRGLCTLGRLFRQAVAAGALEYGDEPVGYVTWSCDGWM